jgi:hypothetical protein
MITFSLRFTFLGWTAVAATGGLHRLASAPDTTLHYENVFTRLYPEPPRAKACRPDFHENATRTVHGDGLADPVFLHPAKGEKLITT